MKFGSRYLRDASSEWDEILQRGLAYPITWTDDLLLRGLLGSQNIEGCKKFCNALLQDGFTDVEDIWHDEGI